MKQQLTQDEAYRDGRRSQDEIIASKPDVGVEQWLAQGAALKHELHAATLEVERVRGRLDAIGTHIANVMSRASSDDPPGR
jgi:hypothetical protein